MFNGSRRCAPIGGDHHIYITDERTTKGKSRPRDRTCNIAIAIDHQRSGYALHGSAELNRGRHRATYDGERLIDLHSGWREGHSIDGAGQRGDDLPRAGPLRKPSCQRNPGEIHSERRRRLPIRS